MKISHHLEDSIKTAIDSLPSSEAKLRSVLESSGPFMSKPELMCILDYMASQNKCSYSAIKYILYESPFCKEINPNRYPFFWTACNLGYADVVQMLLSDERVVCMDEKKSHPLVLACGGKHDYVENEVHKDNMHIEVVKHLVKRPEIMEDIETNNDMLGLAMLGCHSEMMKLLIPFCNGEFDLFKYGEEVGRTITEAEYIEVAKLFMGYGVYNPGKYMQHDFTMASEKGYVNLFNLLKADPRVDPSNPCNAALYVAADRGYSNIVSQLIEDERVHEEGLEGAAYSAKEHGHHSIYNMIMSRADGIMAGC